jgi:hypothetical protein
MARSGSPTSALSSGAAAGSSAAASRVLGNLRHGEFKRVQCLELKIEIETDSFTSGVTMLHELPATVLFSRLPSFDTYKVTDTSFGGCHTDVLIAH